MYIEFVDDEWYYCRYRIYQRTPYSKYELIYYIFIDDEIGDYIGKYDTIEEMTKYISSNIIIEQVSNYFNKNVSLVSR